VDTRSPRRLRYAGRSPAARSRNQAMEIGASDSRAYLCPDGWLERADLVGQVCGSSPHGPTIIFNTLGRFLRNPTETSPVIGSCGVSDSEHDHSSTCFRLPTIHALGFNSSSETRDHRSRLTDGPCILQISCQCPPEARSIRRHTVQVSFTQQVPPKIYCGASLILLLRFCTVLTLTANSVFSINAGLNTSASMKRICRAGAGLLSFILMI